LEVALLRLSIAREGRLRFLVLELVQDLAIRDVANLVVFLYETAITIAYAIFTLRHQSIAYIVCHAYVAVDAFPALFAIARRPLSRGSVLVGERAAQGFGAVFAAETWWADTPAICLAALCELMALEVFEVAVEARRAIVRSVIKERERIGSELGGGKVSMRFLGSGAP
jgi:hypothetical protein